MVPSQLKRQSGAVALAWLAFSNAAFAADLPKVVVLPFAQGEGAPERAGAKFAALVSEELKTREDDLQLVVGPALKAPSAALAPPAKGNKASAEGSAALADGKKALADLKFDEAVTLLKKGIEASLSDPATADFSAVLDGYVSIAVASFRQGEEKSAQTALFAVARLAPDFKLADGKYPPVFTREFEKAKKRAEKASKGTLSIEGPAGSTAFVNGRDLGMVPALDENLPVGPHYVRVEGPRGEQRFGVLVDLKGGVSKVKAVFGGTSAVSASGPISSEPRITAVLDADTAARVAQYVRTANADFALVGIVFRSSEHQVTAASALYSARRQGFVPLPAFAVDHELLTANVEAFKMADEVAKKVAAFGAPAGLPLTLTAEKAVKATVVAAKPVDVDVNVPTGPRIALKPVTKPDPVEGDDAGNVRALARTSTLEGDATKFGANDAPDAGSQVSTGMPVWVWVVVGVGVAAAAGGTVYGVSEASRPVTGTVTATW